MNPVPWPPGDSGVIDPRFLLRAYAAGIFPMALEDGRIGWFSPDPRGILPLDAFHVPKGVRRALRRHGFEITVDRDFRGVVEGCAEREDTWIDGKIVESYGELHALGVAHSVEAWEDGRLAGGLYGVALGGAFFGESMFTRRTDASKICLVHLVGRLRAGGFTLLDTQWTTPHLERFGAREIPRDAYLDLLEEALGKEADWSAVDRKGDPEGGEASGDAYRHVEDGQAPAP